MASPIRPEIQARMGAAHAASTFSTQVTLNPKTRYAVLFNEGSGYLLVDELGAGAYGSTMLVSSLEDHQTYVRKLHNPIRAPADCPDVTYVPHQSHVPRLLSVSSYTQRSRVTHASIWQLCNGGTLHHFLDAWDDNGDLTNIFPEAVVWHFLTTLFETFIEISQQGVVHRDVHAANLVLHWPPNTPLPELFLIDFGSGARFPQVDDLAFKDPWTGDFDQRGYPISNKLSPIESNVLMHWYTAFFDDMKKALQLLSNIQVRQSNGDDRPSPMLKRTVRAWSVLLTRAWVPPSQALISLNMLLSETKAQSDPIIQQFLAQPSHAYRSVRWMKAKVETRTQPALWKNPTRLFAPGQHRHHEYVIQEGGMNGSVDLAAGQFRVVQVAFDQNTLQWSVIKVINSANEVASLSPDDETQYDWSQCDDNARRNQYDLDSGDDGANNGNDDNDEDDRPTLRDIHIPTPFIQKLLDGESSSSSSGGQSSSHGGNLENSDDDPIAQRRRAFQQQLESRRRLHQGNTNAPQQPSQEDNSGGFNDNVVSQRQRDFEAQLALGPPRTQLRLAPHGQIDLEDFDNGPIAQQRRDLQARLAPPQPDPRFRSRSPCVDTSGNNPRAQQRRDYQAQRGAHRPSSHEDDDDADYDYDDDPIAQRRRVHRERQEAHRRGHQGSTNTRQHENNSDSGDLDDDPIAQRRRVYQARLETRQRGPRRDWQ